MPGLRSTSVSRPARPNAVISSGLDRSLARVGAALRRPSAVVVAAWLLSRLLYARAGVSFDVEPLEHSFQLLPRDLLEHDLFRSVWNLHAQPPLFNLFVGTWLHLPFEPAVSLGWTFRAFGLSLALLQYGLLADLGLRRPVAAVIASGFTVLPATVMYENYLSYSLPTALLLLVGARALLKHLRTGSVPAAVTVSGVLAGLVLLRSTYHLGIVVVAVLALLVSCRRRGAGIGAIVAVTVPLLVATGLYTKNVVQWGQFSGSTWLGMNLARVTLDQADPEDIDALIDGGVLSEQARVKSFSYLSLYPAEPRSATGVPALDRELASGAKPNYNNQRYVAISRRYLEDSLTFVRRRPGDYVETVGTSLRFALLPAGDYPFLDVNRDRVLGAERMTSHLLGLQWRRYEDRVGILEPKDGAPGWSQVSWTVALGYGLALFGPVTIWFRRKTREPGVAPTGPDRAAAVTLLASSAVVAYAFVTGITMEIGENNRFRYETDPLVLVIASAVVATAVWTVRGRAGERAPWSPGEGV